MVPLHPTTLAHWMERARPRDDDKFDAKNWLNYWDNSREGQTKIWVSDDPLAVTFNATIDRPAAHKYDIEPGRTSDSFSRVYALLRAYYEDHRER